MLPAAARAVLFVTLTMGSPIVKFYECGHVIQHSAQQHTEKLLKMVTDSAQCIRKHVLSTGKRPVLSLKAMMARGDCYLAAAEDDAAWEFLGEEKEVQVFKLKAGHMKFPESDDKRWPCVKSITVINSAPAAVLRILLDSSNSQRYNQYSIGRVDVDIVSPKTKYVWNKTAVPFAIKPYDFCTVMHWYERTSTISDSDKSHSTSKDRSSDSASGKELVLLSRYAEHPLVPRSKQYSRSENIIGLQILKPLPASGNKQPRTLLTSISHVRYGGTHPFLVSKNLLRGTANYLATFRDFCHRRQTHKQYDK
jgi:hypothetical protein